MKDFVIRIYCEGSSAPGASWIIDVEFRRLSRGFSVWSYEDNILTDKPHWRKVGSCKRRMDWRSICDFLANDGALHVGGDFWTDVKLHLPEAIPPWTADLIKCRFIIDTDSSLDYSAIIDLFSGFTDAEIEAIIKLLNGLIVPPGEEVSQNHEALNSIAKAARELHLTGKTLEAILRRLGMGGGLCPDVTLPYLAEMAQRLNMLKSETYIRQLLEDDRVKSDVQLWRERWSRIIKDQYLDPKWAIRLVSIWLEVTNKPGFHDETVIKWLMNVTQPRQLFSELKAYSSDKALELANHIMKIYKATALRFERPYEFRGGAATGLGIHMARQEVIRAIAGQSVLDELGISFDPQYRIGDIHK